MKYIRLVPVGHQLEAFRGDTGVVQSWLETNTRVVGGGLGVGW
jgi:hypothetical protein